MHSGQSSGAGSSSSSSGSSGGRLSFIKDLEPNQKSVNLMVIVLEIGKPNQTKDGHEIRNVRVADKTGSINLSVWNEYGAVLREGDILRLNGCFTQIWKNSLQIKIGNKGQIIKCGDFMMLFSETPDMSVLSNEVLKAIQEQQAKQPGGHHSTSPVPMITQQKPPQQQQQQQQQQ